MDHSTRLIKLLKGRPHAIGCEVGVYIGKTTSIILNAFPDIKEYHVVDPWGSYEMYDGKKYTGTMRGSKKWSRVIEIFKNNTKKFSNRIVVHRMTSMEAVKKFENEYLDFVYIDANHWYDYIKENLEHWTKRVKIGGIVAGHDYGNPKGKKKGWGIEKAVDEYVEEMGYDLNLFPEQYMYWFVRTK